MKRYTEMFGRLLLLVAISAHLAACAPTTRPLEHSPSDLAWDAWLQQGSRQAAPPRRITTKSLFVFPHLGPESLPACADGYRPDSMGRCVKVVKVDETAHLEFLLQKLNSQFATETSEGQDEAYDYDIESESSDASGPFQFSIPLALQTGSKQDSQEVVLITKKQPNQPIPPPKQSTPAKAPTSSPEVVPEYNNDRNQFFLDNVSAATEVVLQQNQSVSAEPLSILLRNSTTSGITLLAPANGKFENVTAENKDTSIGAALIEELENVKADIIKVVEKLEGLKATTVNPVTELQYPETTVLQSNYLNSNKHVIKPAEEIKTSSEKVVTGINSDIVANNSATSLAKNYTVVINKRDNNESLVNQIQALKVEHQDGVPTETNPAENLETSSKVKEAKDNSTTAQVVELSPTKIDVTSDRTSVDFEEKVKKIRQFADVSRNTEGPFSTNGIGMQKKTSGDYVRFPSTQSTNGESSTDLNKAASSSTLLQFPPDYVRAPNYAPGGAPLLFQEKTPMNYQKDRNFQDSSERPPYWLPYGWNVNNPSGEHNLMDLWSRMSSMQRYPYNVRFENDRHHNHHQNLYPSSQESGQRASVRHTPVNYRQGRDDIFRGRQVYQDESMNYKRSRHPHFRESEELSRILEAFNGR